MPKSRKRKRAGKPVVRQQVVLPSRVPEFPDRWELKVKASQVHYLKSDPDFLMMLKIGRMLNAISFSMTAYASFLTLDTFYAKRQQRRGLLVMAGYIHESIAIIKSVDERHNTMESFVPLRKIAHNPEYAKAREYARMIRNVSAFHLAESERYQNTKRSLDDLELSAYTLMGADDNSAHTFYFELADYLDYALIGRHFQNGREPEETMNDITGTILEVVNEILTGGFNFLTALARKMELSEYVYGQKTVTRT